ncbi:hypothetical protein ACFV2H_23775 [Streptomyces sp. NPDC059629]|uniref:hypothetical protein n=1 Tax=Streptomyces sp. NPDC059629 TaxID=3346889 RepID=UPI0036B2F288
MTIQAKAAAATTAQSTVAAGSRKATLRLDALSDPRTVRGVRRALSVNKAAAGAGVTFNSSI